MISSEIQNYVQQQIASAQRQALYSTQNAAGHTHNGIDSPLISSASSSTIPTGFISPYGGSSAPTAYLLCDGTSYVRGTYANLFAIIGTTFGSADSTHFNVPDLRGNVPAG